MEKSAGFILFRKEENNFYFLLLHYKAGHWDFPRGHVEENETELDAALRELKEETNIFDIKVIEGFRESYRYLFSNNKKEKEVVLMLAQTKQKEVILSFEHMGYRWVNYENALKLITYENPKLILQKAKAFLDNYFKTTNL
jgi:8-oxo-dGTP pyrophosphatase MutT (NUDIX family)